MGNVDIRPDLAAEGGGLVDDFDGVVTDIRFVPDDYNGTLPEPITLCHVVFDVDGEESVQNYSIGGDKDFAPDETGRGLTKLRTKAALTKTCKLMLFMNSLVEAGFPLNKMDARDVSPIIGVSGHFLRKAAEYKGLKSTGDREKTVLLCTKINKLPWEQAKGKAKGKGKAAAVDEGLADSMAGIIQSVLIEGDGEMAKKNLLSALFKNDDVKALDDKKAALKLASDDAWLKERDEWTFEDGVLKLG